MATFLDTKEKESSTISKHIILSDEQYKQDYDALESTTNFGLEQFVVDQIKNRIANQLIKTTNFLDIGCGPGRITKALSLMFQSTTVIEPNSCQLANFQEYTDIKIHNTTFEDYYKVTTNSASRQSTSIHVVEPEKFDFILCSHVFYHIPDENWTSVIDKMISLLHPQHGVLYIAMETDQSGLDTFRKTFKADYLGSIITEAQKGIYFDKLDIDSIYTVDKSKSTDKDVFYRSLKFVVLENCFNKYNAYGKLTDEEKLDVDNRIWTEVERCKCIDSVTQQVHYEIDFRCQNSFFKFKQSK